MGLIFYKGGSLCDLPIHWTHPREANEVVPVPYKETNNKTLSTIKTLNDFIRNIFEKVIYISKSIYVTGDSSQKSILFFYLFIFMSCGPI